MVIFLIVLGIIIALIVLEEIIELIYKKSNDYKKTLGGADRFKNVPQNIDICNIGSGPGLYAISYDDRDKLGFNFATAPQSYKNGFRILKRFKNNINENAIIIIIMCPLSFGKNNDYDAPNYMDKFYGILPKEDIDGYSIKRLWIVNHPFFIKCLRKIKRLFVKLKKIINKKNNLVITKQNSTIENWKKEFNLKDLKDSSQSVNHKEAFDEKIDNIEQGIKFCQDNKWKPVFVIPPIPRGTREYISDEFINEFVYKNLSILQNKYSSVKTFDYFKDNRFTNEYFANDIFVNEKGKKLFSSILFNDLEAFENETCKENKK